MQNEYPYCAEADDGATGGAGTGGGDSLPAASDAGGDVALPESPQAPESLRDTLTQAFDDAEKADAQPRADVEAPLRGRDEKGRFAPGQQPAPRLQAPAQARAPAPAAAGVPALKPPPSWKPEARAEWAKLTPAVQQEVYRRENEVGRALQDSAQARGMVQEFSGILSPYAHNIAASGVPATEMVKQLFEADNGLRHSTPLRKAQIVANIIASYGIDIQTLDGVLAGAAPQDDPQQRLLDQLRGEFQRQLQPMQGFLQHFQSREQRLRENLQGEVAQEIEQLADREHFEDLRGDMADILERAAAHNVAMTMEQAYDRALRLHPTLYESVARQNDQARAQRAREAAQRARAAAISRPSGAPAGHGAPAGGSNGSLRDTLSAAWDAHEQ
jgi:hypothetical protein